MFIAFRGRAVPKMTTCFTTLTMNGKQTYLPLLQPPPSLVEGISIYWSMFSLLVHKWVSDRTKGSEMFFVYNTVSSSIVMFFPLVNQAGWKVLKSSTFLLLFSTNFPLCVSIFVLCHFYCLHLAYMAKFNIGESSDQLKPYQPWKPPFTALRRLCTHSWFSFASNHLLFPSWLPLFNTVYTWWFNRILHDSITLTSRRKRDCRDLAAWALIRPNASQNAVVYR